MNKKITSTIIVIAIIIVIAGIWIFKNKNKTNNADNSDFELNITSNFDIEKLKSYNLPIIIDFGSEGCMPCRQMAPALKQVNNELRGKAIIRFIDVWEYPDLANGYPIELIPTQIFINKDGTPYAPKNAEELELQFVTDEQGNHTLTTHIGALTVEQMKSMLKEMGLNE